MIRRILGGNIGGGATAVIRPNFYIQHTSITTSSGLATFLGISSASIENFSNNGQYSSADILNNYTLLVNSGRSTSLLGFRDLQKCIDLGGSQAAFDQNTTNKEIELESVSIIQNYDLRGMSGFADPLKILRLPNAVTFGIGNIISYDNLVRCYIPKAQTFDVECLKFLPNTCKIYTNPFLQTSNGGAEDATIARNRTEGKTIIYVQNFIKPSSINNLTHSAGVLSFTPPASTNALSFYEVYVNGFWKQDISGSGATVSGLIAGDKVTVYACDIYYNRSKSNEITI